MFLQQVAVKHNRTCHVFLRNLQDHRTCPITKSRTNQVILAGTLTGVQGDIRCEDLAALSTVK